MPTSHRRDDPPRTATGLRADVEGLRGVAVGMVLLYHLGVPGVGGGFAGVDVFFVISGFLITSLLLREIDRTGGISLRAFYARRARRLLPAASLVLAVTAVAGWWVLPGSAQENLGRDVATSALYVVNWELAGRSVDYLAEGEAPSVLQHYWSLAVEEQFYVVWPLLILLALAVARRRGVRPEPLLLGAVATVGLASFAWSVHLTATDPGAAYFVTTTRMWELALGAGLAFAAPRLGVLTPRARALLVTAGTGVALVRTVPDFVVPDGADAPGARALVDDPGARQWRVNRAPDRFYTTEGQVLPDPSVAKKDGLLRRCQVSRDVTEPRLGGECTFGDVDSDERVMLLGDSKMGQWFPAMEQIAEREGWRLDVHLKSSCPVARTGVEQMCTDHTDALLEAVADDPPDRAIVSQYLDEGQYDHADDGLERAIGEIRDAGVEVAVLADNPAPPTDATYECVERHPGAYDACAFDRERAVAASGAPRLAELADTLGLRTMDVNEWVCPEGDGEGGDVCPAVVAGTLVYRQGSHLTGTYVRSLTPMLHRELARIGWARTPVADIRLGRR